MKRTRFTTKILSVLLSTTLISGIAVPTSVFAAPAESDLETGSDTSPVSPGEDYPEKTINYVTFKDMDPGTVIEVNAPSGYTSADVLNGITFENVSAPIYTSGTPDLLCPDILEADGGNGHFVLSDKDNFKKGDVYQIVLEDDALSFSNYDSDIRIYNLTIEQDDVFNARLNPNIKMLNSASLNSDDAEELKLFDGVFGWSSGSGNFTEDNKGFGSFTMEPDAYAAGDTIAVYNGTIPTERSLEDTDGSVAYVTITDVQTNEDGTVEYLYESAEAKNIIFTPDVIPVHDTASFSNGTGTITMTREQLQLTADGEFAEIGLDENTQVDIGDYLAFYTGSKTDGAVTSYAKITDLKFQDDENDSMIITYRQSSLDELLTTTDLYRKAALPEGQLLNDTDVETIKANAMAQFESNGLLTASTYELTEAVLDTQEVKDAFGDTPVENLNFYFGDDESVSMTGAAYSEIAASNDPSLYSTIDVKGDPDLSISPNIVHFAGKTGYGSGVRLELYARYHITIRPDDPTSKTMLKIEMAFYFETELMVGFTVDASSIWRRLVFIPYLYDISVTGSYGIGYYTGAGITTVATLVKYEAEKPKEEQLAGFEWPEELDGLEGSQRIRKLAEFVSTATKKHDSIFPAQDTGGGTLAKKYAAFAYAANNKDWVDIFDLPILNKCASFDPLHLISFRFKADVVVSTELHVALGVALNYEESNIETFNFLLFHEGYSNKHIEDSENNTFRLDEYLFGVLGIRAGLRLTPMVGLFDARLDSIGFEYEGGLYARFWGLIYGGYEMEDGKDKPDPHTYFSGAFLADAGAYFTITFIAQLADGKISKKVPVDNGEYPFLSFGTPDLTFDFAYKQGEKDFSVEYTRYQTQTVIPSDLAVMSSMDLKSGQVSNTSKAGESLLENYQVSFDDLAFSYNYENGKHLLLLDHNKMADKKKGTVTMTLTWKGSACEFNTDKIERTIKIDWVYDLCTIQFLNKDGSIFYLIAQPAGTVIDEKDYPDAPTAKGYTFKGWSLSGLPGTEVTIPPIMPSDSLVYKGIWERNHADVKITYKRYVMNDDHGGYYYTTDVTDTIPAFFYEEDTVDNIITALQDQNLIRTNPEYYPDGQNPYEHYQINYNDSVLSCDSIAADGSTEFVIALIPEFNTITFVSGFGETQTDEYIYGDTVRFPAFTHEKCHLVGWVDENGNVVSQDQPPVVTKDATFTAVWENDPTTVTVKAQIKQKSPLNPMDYKWVTLKTVTFTIDTSKMDEDGFVDADAITVKELSADTADQNDDTADQDATISGQDVDTADQNTDISDQDVADKGETDESTVKITVAKLIEMLELDGYTFDSDNSAYTLDSIITLPFYTDTQVTLRFK